MANDVAQISGEVQTQLSHRALVARLVTAGLRAGLRESCHYAGGCYIRFDERAYFILEQVAAGEYLANGDADSAEQMREAAARVSGALAGLGIRHRFEVYDGRPEMVEYLHHPWPQAADA
jgi:hypothetical protein